jgi:N6-adenosine-specific RNA methylase IME4
MKYRTIIADPPWRYGGTDQFGNTRHAQVKGRFNGGTRSHYPTMATSEICALPVGAIAADDAVLLLWATWPTLRAAFAVIDAWGFEYVTGFPWIKVTAAPQRSMFTDEYEYRPQFGIGFWVRSCSEAVLVCRKGRPSMPEDAPIGLISDNFGHSRKPENLYEYAEQFPGPYLELFARRPRDGWDVWGNQVASTVEVG